MSFYSEQELQTIGFKSYGQNVKMSRYARLYNPESITIGNNVRIDDFCLLSAGNNPFIIEDNIHISAGVYIYGTAGFHIQSYSNISAGVKIFTVNDDYSGDYLVGPTIPEQYRNVKKEAVVIGKYCVVGANSVVLPGCSLEEGVAIGANSFVNKPCDEWNIYAGTPIRCVKPRSRKLLLYTTESDCSYV